MRMGRSSPRRRIFVPVWERCVVIRIGLATNQQNVRAAFMVDELGYRTRFDDLLISCQLGHAKPGAEYFHAVLELLDLSGAQVLFLDDHASNVEVARKVGLKAEQYHLDSGVSAMLALLARHGIRLVGER